MLPLLIPASSRLCFLCSVLHRGSAGKWKEGMEQGGQEGLWLLSCVRGDRLVLLKGWKLLCLPINPFYLILLLPLPVASQLLTQHCQSLEGRAAICHLWPGMSRDDGSPPPPPALAACYTARGTAFLLTPRARNIKHHSLLCSELGWAEVAWSQFLSSLAAERVSCPGLGHPNPHNWAHAAQMTSVLRVLCRIFVAQSTAGGGAGCSWAHSGQRNRCQPFLRFAQCCTCSPFGSEKAAMSSSVGRRSPKEKAYFGIQSLSVSKADCWSPNLQQ